MPILTELEAANALGYISVDEMPERVTDELPGIDRYIEEVTGKDWGALSGTYTEAEPLAKRAAKILLNRTFGNPETDKAVDPKKDPLVWTLALLQSMALQEKQAMTDG